jgi:hypothetical protein
MSLDLGNASQCKQRPELLIDLLRKHVNVSATAMSLILSQKLASLPFLLFEIHLAVHPKQ